MNTLAGQVLCVIPARGGSAGIPRKNIRALHGKPLLQYTAETALAVRQLARVVLSTDDEEIAEVGRQCGLDVPFLRPAELARSDTPMKLVAQHALRAVERDTPGVRFDAVCLLQPTVPFRCAGDVDRCIMLLQETDADTVMTVRLVPARYNPHWVFLQSADGRLRLSTGEAVPILSRQELPLALHRDGSVYVTRRAAVEQGRLLGAVVRGIVLDSRDHINIKEPDDWTRAEQIFARRAAEFAKEYQKL